MLNVDATCNCTALRHALALLGISLRCMALQPQSRSGMRRAPFTRAVGNVGLAGWLQYPEANVIKL